MCFGADSDYSKLRFQKKSMSHNWIYYWDIDFFLRREIRLILIYFERPIYETFVIKIKKVVIEIYSEEKCFGSSSSLALNVYVTRPTEKSLRQIYVKNERSSEIWKSKLK